MGLYSEGYYFVSQIWGAYFWYGLFFFFEGGGGGLLLEFMVSVKDSNSSFQKYYTYPDNHSR